MRDNLSFDHSFNSNKKPQLKLMWQRLHLDLTLLMLIFLLATFGIIILYMHKLLWTI